MTRDGAAAMQASRCGSATTGRIAGARGVANWRPDGVAVTRASSAGAASAGAIGTARGAAVALAMRRHRHARQRAVPEDRVEARPKPHRPRRSERDARRRGRDASEPVRVCREGSDCRRAMRSELATRRGRRDASEQCRHAVRWGDRHGAMRSGSVGDAAASPRPPASRAGRWSWRACPRPTRSPFQRGCGRQCGSGRSRVPLASWPGRHPPVGRGRQPSSRQVLTECA